MEPCKSVEPFLPSAQVLETLAAAGSGRPVVACDWRGRSAACQGGTLQVVLPSWPLLCLLQKASDRKSLRVPELLCVTEDLAFDRVRKDPWKTPVDASKTLSCAPYWWHCSLLASLAALLHARHEVPRPGALCGFHVPPRRNSFDHLQVCPCTSLLALGSRGSSVLPIPEARRSGA